MKLAIVADWLTTYGGAEHVLAELAALYPTAPIFTTVVRRGRIGPLATLDLRPTSLQWMYRIVRNHQLLLPWMPRAIEGIDLTGFDVVLSSSHAVAKGVIVPPTALHICYCHTPMRYAWEMQEQYLDDFRIPRLLRPPIRRMLKRLREWDLSTAKRVDVFLANSTATAERIERIYGRRSTVISPPVSSRFFDQYHTESTTCHGEVHRACGATNPCTSIVKGFLAFGRLVPYKRFDLLIAAANAQHFPLTIAGCGQDEHRLRSLAGPTVTFLGHVDDVDLPKLYASHEALLFPQLEDAGIVPLEAQACGLPVIAYGKGGALDTVQDGVTGVLFREQTEESLVAAIHRFHSITFDRKAIRTHAKTFSQERFREAVSGVMEREYAKFGEKY